MTTQNESVRVALLANDIAAFALQRAKEKGCSPKELIRGLSAATIATTTSISLPEKRHVALIVLASNFMDDVLRIAKAVDEEGEEDMPDDEVRLN